jgi:hypothetical protein
MSAPLEKPAPASSPAGAQRQTKTAGGKDLGQDTSREAKRLAAAILEVLAGARTPTEAATALGLSVPRYYQMESRALGGLLSACEPKPKGRVRRAEQEASALRQDNQRLQREITRQQSLMRAAQRTVGWTPPVSSAPAKNASKTTAKKTRKRRLARALSVAVRLQAPTPDAVPSTDAPAPPEGTERNV